MRKIFHLSLLLVLSLFFAFVFFEFSLRIFSFPPFPDRHNPRVFAPDDETGIKFLPNSHDIVSSFEYKTSLQINELGLRDRPGLIYENPYPVVIIGDSFTEGRGVNLEDTFVKKLEAEIKRPVLNLGISSIGTREEVIFLKRYLSKIKQAPQTIILAFYEGNDFFDNNNSIHGPVLSASNGYLVNKSQTVKEIDGHIYLFRENGEKCDEFINDKFHPPFSSKIEFIDQSKIFNLIANSLFANKNFREFLFKNKYAKKKEPSLPIAIPGFLDKKFDWKTSSDWANTKQYLDEFIAVAKEQSAKPLVVIIPAKYQLFPELVSQYPGDFSPESVNSDGANYNLQNYFKSKSVAYIDFLDEFRKLPMSSRKKLYFNGDTHWTAFGHEKAASIISHYLNLN